MHAPRVASFLLSLSFASAMASAAMAGFAESRSMGLKFYGCASGEGTIVLDSLDERVLPICRRNEVLVTWNTDESAFTRM
ncbi:hypothetical protein [Lysobacter niastensis]|uniref:Uncharacterized protein n=1 Tax=Lysobacter niastensis TaxID=380629 RepID=A0ABS0B8M7_9GAMM|nr:hypothetical protein [Lysobacter niastensis]MBF6024588.1 hypothetical protein [Lysobacter niastensis]